MTSRRSSFGVSAAGLVALAGCAALSLVASAQDEPNIEQGKAVYEHWCAPCHASGPGHPGTQSLQLKYNGSLPAVLLERTDLPAETILARL